MKRAISAILIVAALSAALTVSAGAVDYNFTAKNNDDFYRSTNYEDVYGSQYNYGGQNVVDFYDTSLLPGFLMLTPQTASPDYLIPGIPAEYDVSGDYAPEFTVNSVPAVTAHTSVDGLKRSDGSIGTLVIPSLSINMKAYEGTSSASMSKGLGHFPESSGWNGNVALCGHNRGAQYVIGGIKDLKTGDIIKYTTVLGTRTYAVTFVGTISRTDWTYISATSDNRITLVTCLSNQPEYRTCVQAVEIK